MSGKCEFKKLSRSSVPCDGTTAEFLTGLGHARATSFDFDVCGWLVIFSVISCRLAYGRARQFAHSTKSPKSSTETSTWAT